METKNETKINEEKSNSDFLAEIRKDIPNMSYSTKVVVASALLKIAKEKQDIKVLIFVSIEFGDLIDQLIDQIK